MNRQIYSTRYKPRTVPMVVGAVMLGAGALMGFAGMIVGCAGMITSARMWWDTMADQAQDSGKPSWNKSARETIAAGGRAMGGNGAPARSGRG